MAPGNRAVPADCVRSVVWPFGDTFVGTAVFSTARLAVLSALDGSTTAIHESPLINGDE